MRLFVGIPISDDVRDRLKSELALIPHLPVNCRPVDPERWHFTMAFLGEVAEEQMEGLTALLTHAVQRPPKGAFRFTDFRTFPVRRSAYLVANALADPANEWIAYIEHMNDMLSVAAPHIDRKPWMPHVTIGRAKRGMILAPWRHEITPFEWRPAGLALIQSTQTQTGSTYTTIHDYPLDI